MVTRIQFAIFKCSTPYRRPFSDNSGLFECSLDRDIDPAELVKVVAELGSESVLTVLLATHIRLVINQVVCLGFLKQNPCLLFISIVDIEEK